MVISGSGSGHQVTWSVALPRGGPEKKNSKNRRGEHGRLTVVDVVKQGLHPGSITLVGAVGVPVAW